MKSILFAFISLFSITVYSQVQYKEYTEVELISETVSVKPGTSAWIGLRFKMDDHWHVYWRNPGDSGIPPKIFWTLPNGVSAGEIQWPYPEKIDMPPLTSFAHSNELLLISEIKIRADFAEKNLTIKAKAEWLICQDICLPGDAQFEMTLPVTTEVPKVDLTWQDLFTATRFKLPVSIADWKFTAQPNTGKITIRAVKPDWFSGEISNVRYFPFEQEIIENLAEQNLTITDDGFILDVPLATNHPVEKLDGILVSENGWRGKNSEKAITISVAVTDEMSAPVGNFQEILLALLFAFIGGMILNLMPCVLPVLSLKILGFVQQAEKEKSSVFKHGMVFTFGVLISFWILAGLLLILRSGGEQLGWGFQLQSPTFIIILSSFLFLFALNLFGVFEIGTSLTQAGSIGSQSTGWLGSFLNGVTATIVATPCTAPFMGTALGFALSQSAFISILIFTFLGLGMAFPYLILASSPALLKFVPRPGEWMNTLKQLMGFFLLATVVWLVWVLGIQAGANAIVGLIAGLLLLGLSAWVLGKWGTIIQNQGKRITAYTVSVLLISLAIFIAVSALKFSVSSGNVSANPVSSENAGMKWENYTPTRFEELKNSGQPFFIDFTAAWCLSCQVNDKVVFASENVISEFRNKNIVALKADWTSRDENITKALASYGRNSVPLYVLYERNNPTPKILPELITPGIMLDALADIN